MIVTILAASTSYWVLTTVLPIAFFVILVSRLSAVPTPGPSYDLTEVPYRIAVLCYLKDASGRVLLLHRRKEPNAGLYSPIGGKLEVSVGEGPHARLDAACCAPQPQRQHGGAARPGCLPTWRQADARPARLW